MKLQIFLTGIGMAFGLMSEALAQNPFSVVPSVQVTNGQRLVRVAFAVPTNYFLYANTLSFQLSGEGSPTAFALPEPLVVDDKFSGKRKMVFGQDFEASHVVAGAVAGPLALSVRFQGCDEANCFFPEEKTFTIALDGTISQIDGEAEPSVLATPAKWRKLMERFTVADRGSGYLNEASFLAFLDKAQSGKQATQAVEAHRGIGGFLLMMCLIVLGGAALNLTPCVLPMIPINIAIIGAGAQAGSKKRGFGLGTTYAAGMAVAYGLLGLVVVLTGSKFGTLNSSPWFNLGIAVVFVVLALGMFDVLAIDLSRFQRQSSGGGSSSKGSFFVAYSMGTVAALLAGACVAPVVISVLLQATNYYNAGITAGLLLPFLLGLGMGMPWPFAGAGLSFLPKPGRWMTRVKHGFGVFIILFAAYYGYLSFGLFRSSSNLASTSVGGLGSSVADADLGDELAQTLRQAIADRQPVFIDFWASWCKNCSAMEHTTFQSVAVKDRLSEFRQVRLQTEKPNQATAKELLDHFKLMGLPSYVVLLPKASEPAVPAARITTASIAP